MSLTDTLVAALIEEYGADDETWRSMRSAARVAAKVRAEVLSEVVVQGCCPACGSASLVSRAGVLTCTFLGCPQKNALATIVADNETEHIVTITKTGYVARHPLGERANGDLFVCPLIRRLRQHVATHDRPEPGRYRVTQGVALGFERVADDA